MPWLWRSGGRCGVFADIPGHELPGSLRSPENRTKPPQQACHSEQRGKEGMGTRPRTPPLCRVDGTAAAFVRECAAGVESGDGLKSLYARGLTVETAHTLGIGWNPADRYGRRADWGLDEEVNPETGRFRKVWLPRGLVLPIRRKAGVTALLIRRADWKPKDDLPKYWQAKGSGNGCYGIGKPGLPVVLVESLLDAVLVWQEARDVAAAVALTGASKRPDAGTTAFLRAAPLILWSLDFDEAGTKAWAWWREHFPGVKAWPCACGQRPRRHAQGRSPDPSVG